MLKAVDDVRKETPPRVWGRHKFFPAIPLGFRNTPTHVGKTVIRIRHMALAQKHPHACGEDTPTWTMLLITLETPPRMWGRHRHRLSWWRFNWGECLRAINRYRLRCCVRGICWFRLLYSDSGRFERPTTDGIFRCVLYRWSSVLRAGRF